jgi:hypothetical protein
METEEQNAVSAEATNEPVSFESALDRLNTPDEPAAPETAEAAPEGDEADKAEAPKRRPTPTLTPTRKPLNTSMATPEPACGMARKSPSES